MSDPGSAVITREKDGTITIRVRSPNAEAESVINMPWDNWASMRVAFDSWQRGTEKSL